MSRIGNQPVKIEEGVTVNVNGREVAVSGPIGQLKVVLPESLTAEIKDGEVLVARKNEEKQSKSVHGTFRALIQNMVTGVKTGYERKLEMSGVGYRAKQEGKDISVTVGYTHPVKVIIPEGITATVPDEITIVLKGADKQKVGEMAAKIRGIKKPEPYKGKGIKYAEEIVRRKSAKSAATAK